MDALYNRSGQVVAWLDRVAGQIVDLQGHHRAFVDGDSVYDYSGRHAGWWQDGHVRDHSGAVDLFTRYASNLGVYRPHLAFPPYPPYKAFAPFRPFKEFKPFRPFMRSQWSDRSLLG